MIRAHRTSVRFALDARWFLFLLSLHLMLSVHEINQLIAAAAVALTYFKRDGRGGGIYVL